ncbi:hypothetical protein CEP51_014250 [Fusarium floridanum]|uniref:Uncharacterized protein n=1 Tax=Fusarium floridanum TaxID=1325733 RepID=A0A428PWP2_9HYPO|nr:hypothetical protein CEP51_014250 [Fusarium floridanum]
MTPGGTFKNGTEIYNDYFGYKTSQAVAKQAQVDYDTEATSRDRTGAGANAAGEVPTPPRNKPKDRGVFKGKVYYKDDHDALGILAGDAGNKTEAHATDRDNFNAKYEQVWVNKGGNSLERHQTEATIQHNTAKNWFKKETVHNKYK